MFRFPSLTRFLWLLLLGVDEVFSFGLKQGLKKHSHSHSLLWFRDLQQKVPMILCCYLLQREQMRELNTRNKRHCDFVGYR